MINGQFLSAVIASITTANLYSHGRCVKWSVAITCMHDTAMMLYNSTIRKKQKKLKVPGYRAI